MAVKKEHCIFISKPYQVIANTKNFRPINRPFLPTKRRLQR